MTSSVRFMTGARAMIAVAFAAAMLMSLAPAAYAADDYATLAQTYKQQAADLRASAEKHLAEAKAHRGGAGPSKMQHESIARHCEALAKNLQAAAAESDALAQTYDGLAKSK